MTLKGSTYFLISLLLLSLIFIVVALTWPFLEDRLLWIMVNSVFLVMVVAQLLKDIRSRNKGAAPAAIEAGKDTNSKVKMKRFGFAMGWLRGFLLITYLIGFLLSIPLFSFSYVKVHGVGWLKSVVFAILLVAVLYIIFVIGLRVELYRGLLFLL